MIEVEHIVKNYGSHIAVNDISFTMKKGRIYGFLGPNGAGKSTTMNIMTGYLAATSGQVRINGRDILEDALAAKKDIGFLPEIPPVLPDLTVNEYLRYTARLKNIPSRYLRDVQAKVLQMTGLGAWQSKMIKNLSKGYRQRVGLAGAIIGLPEIIILDEPTVGLDPAQMIEIRNLISSLRTEHTVVLSSHILSEVSSVCDELIIISNGQKVAEGTLAELEEKYCKGNILTLKAFAPADEVMRVLNGIQGVISAKVLKQDITMSPAPSGDILADKKAGGDGRVKNGECSAFMLETDQAAVVQEKVGRTLFEAGIPVVELYHDQKTLEEVFLNVTGISVPSQGSGSGTTAVIRNAGEGLS